MALTVVLPPSVAPVSAAFGSSNTGGDRTLYLHHTHTGQTGSFTFKRNGQYDQKVLRELNIFLADWRTKEPTKMDPALFDLLWEVYQEVGGKQPYNIVSSYRSPKTNKMLASKSSASPTIRSTCAARRWTCSSPGSTSPSSAKPR